VRKRISLVGLLFTFHVLFCTAVAYGETECDVVDFYKVIAPESGVKILTTLGSIEEAEYILLPLKLDTGRYKISLTRKGSNLYKIDGKDIYIETRYCYEYAIMQDAILSVEGSYGYTKGKIIFLD
jgi:hypothetical protein